MSVKLHIGSGPWYADGWVNVDMGDDSWYLPNRPPDVYANVLEGLPFDNGTFERIYMGHFLEHIFLEDMKAMFTELHRVSAPGAKLGVVGPCMDLAVAQNCPPNLLAAIREDPGDMHPGSHKWTPTAAKTKEVMDQNGIISEQVHISRIHQPDWCNPNNTAEWQCAFLASWDESAWT